MEDLKEFLHKQGLRFRRLELVEEAFTHPSFAHERQGRSAHNQRLEYLGDSVLNLIINDYLYERFANCTEGELSRMCSILVREEMLAKIAAQLGLGACLRLGRGEKKNRGSQRSSNLADCLEAFIGALYLDQGFSCTRSYVRKCFDQAFQNISYTKDSKDAKSLLQEWTQKELQLAPVYELVSQTGPSHQSIFQVRVKIQDKEYARGEGPSMKDAEKKAAQKLLKRFEDYGFASSITN